MVEGVGRVVDLVGVMFIWVEIRIGLGDFFGAERDLDQAWVVVIDFFLVYLRLDHWWVYGCLFFVWGDCLVVVVMY